MSFEFQCRAGSIIGCTHARKHINNQDAYTVKAMTVDGKPYLYGAVFDGSTLRSVKGSRNEVGAVLLSAFVSSEIPFILSAHTGLHQLPDILYQRCLGYLGSIARATVVGGPEVAWDFIQKHLLSTILGFVMDEDDLVIFWAGDGVYIVNDAVTVIEQDNMPLYIGYHLVDRSILGDATARLPQTFETKAYDATSVKRLAICSDAMSARWKEDPSSILHIFTHEPQAPAGIQWWLNKQQLQEVFADDCTIVALQRKES